MIRRTGPRLAVPTALVAGTPRVALAHPGAPLEPHDLLAAWSADPLILVPLAIFALAYAYGVSELWRASGTGRGVRRSGVACFAGGWLLLALALLSPLHALGEALFSAHMAQHELIMVVAAPLLVLGQPFVALVWAVPRSRRRPVMRLVQRPGLRRAWARVASPASAWALHAVAIWLWHLPGPYQRTLTEPPIHALQHTSFIATALLFWWALLRGSRMGAGAAIVYLFTTMLHTGALGVLLTFAPSLWYPAYATSTVAWGLTPMEDQQLGGLIMWIPGGVTYIVAALALLVGWMRDSEARVRLGERMSPALRRASVLLLPLLVLAACGDSHDDRLASLAGGDARRGRDRIEAYGCAGCHTIPGIRGANALVGPPLAGIAQRVYVGGVVTNTPANLVAWIQNPRAFSPKTAMPNLGVRYDDAVDIASYLYTLK